MREILFRGKTLDGKWVQGDLSQHTTGKKFIRSKNKSALYSDEVIPKTIEQYTGLTDKNGTKIFEGDIVKTDKFSEPNKQYIIKYDLQFGAFIGQDRYNCYFVTFDGDSDEFEVVGNIHDNPELLKE